MDVSSSHAGAQDKNRRVLAFPLHPVKVRGRTAAFRKRAPPTRGDGPGLYTQAYSSYHCGDVVGPIYINPPKSCRGGVTFSRIQFLLDLCVHQVNQVPADMTTPSHDRRAAELLHITG